MDPKNRTLPKRLTAGLLLVGLLTLLPNSHAVLTVSTFDLQDHAEETDVVSGWCWRGYTFTVSETTIVSALHGGYRSGPGTWHLALYEAPELEMGGQSADRLLASGEITEEGEPFTRVPVTPTILTPGQPYLLAIGKEDGGGSFYRVGEIDVGSILSEEPLIDGWGPDDGRAFNFSCTGGPEHPVNTGASSHHTTVRPHLGFETVVLDL